MSPQENRTIVRRFITEVLDNGNMSLLDQLCAPNYVNRATGQGVDSLKQLGGLMKTAVPDFHLTIENVEDDPITNQDMMQLLGIPMQTPSQM